MPIHPGRGGETHVAYSTGETEVDLWAMRRNRASVPCLLSCFLLKSRLPVLRNCIRLRISCVPARKCKAKAKEIAYVIVYYKEPLKKTHLNFSLKTRSWCAIHVDNSAQLKIVCLIRPERCNLAYTRTLHITFLCHS